MPFLECMKRIIIYRGELIEDKAYLGTAFLMDSNVLLYKCRTVELPYRDNRRNVSCVPQGTYDLVLEYSPRFGRYLWELKGVPNRSECKIHPANEAKQLNGCIAPGAQYFDLDGDGVSGVSGSRYALNRINLFMGADTIAKITIIDND